MQSKSASRQKEGRHRTRELRERCGSVRADAMLLVQTGGDRKLVFLALKRVSLVLKYRVRR